MSQQQQQPGGDDFMLIGVIAIICGLLIFAVIAAQEMRVNAVIGAVTWVHILPFALAGEYLPWLSEIPFAGPWLFGYSVRALTFLEKGGFAAMDPAARTAVLVAGGRCATVIYGAILVWIALRGQEFRVDQKYRTLHTLESMIFIQSENWVTSRLARHVNPLKGTEIDARRIAEAVSSKLSGKAAPGGVLPECAVSLQPGTWNRSLRPEEWLIGNGLAFDPKMHGNLIGPESSAGTSDFEFKHMWEALDIEEVSEILSAQLRSPWQGPEQLRPSLRALYAVMALFYGYDIDGGNKLLNELGLIADAVKAKRGGMDDAIRAEDGLLGRIDKIALGKQGTMLSKKAAHHAWVESAFPTFLSIARKDRGVLPPAAFLWLKAEDRLMWYILNNVGNDAVMVEAAGALAHCRAENQIQKPLRRPAVYQAARAILEDYLDMTPDRIASRKEKLVRRRTPGAQLDLLRDQIMSEGSSDLNPEEA